MSALSMLQCARACLSCPRRPAAPCVSFWGRYCDEHGEEGVVSRAELYLLLLGEYLQGASEPKLESAFELLQARRLEFDPAAVFKLLPAHVPLAKLERLLAILLCEAQQRRDQAQLRCSLLKARSVQVHAELLEARSSRVVVSELSPCGACGKRIGTAAFSVQPGSGVLLHVACRALHS